MSAVLPLRKHRLPQFQELHAFLRAIFSERLAEDVPSLLLEGINRVDGHSSLPVDGLQAEAAAHFDKLIADAERLGEMDGVEGLVCAERPEDPGQRRLDERTGRQSGNGDSDVLRHAGRNGLLDAILATMGEKPTRCLCYRM